jgi:hypothetical protein
MNFYEVLEQVLVLLQRHGRVSYRALKRQFDLDDDYLEDLKVELIEVRELAEDRDNKMLVWTGEADPPSESDGHREADAEARFHAIIPVLIGLLQREGRITYPSLMQIFGLDEVLLGNLRKELILRRLAVDEDGQVLTWAGERPNILRNRQYRQRLRLLHRQSRRCLAHRQMYPLGQSRPRLPPRPNVANSR